jgi:predicted molibdopterin-dependent oxidoreductase YjgC
MSDRTALQPSAKSAPPRQVLTLDGQEVEFSPGETIYEVAKRNSRFIPTLCYDPRLEAFGSCRLCVVEVEGMRGPVASCTTKATPGMKVRTATEPVDKFRKTLLEMVVSENRELEVSAIRGFASQELKSLVYRYGAKTGRFRGRRSGKSHPKDDNPFILRDYDLCISCYRCVRVCAEQEGDYAISVRGRGFDTQITTEFDNRLKDSACTFCGQCVQTCPTGALADRKAMNKWSEFGFEKTNGNRAGEVAAAPAAPGRGLSALLTPARKKEAEAEGDTAQPFTKTRTICPYCGVGCSVDILTKSGRIVGVHPAMDGPANRGALCVKGQFAFDFVQHEDRLKMPLLRQPDGSFKEVDWDTALDAAAAGFRQALEKYGRRSLYGIASGRAPHEAAYTMQKFIRAGCGTHHIDNCSRA